MASEWTTVKGRPARQKACGYCFQYVNYEENPYHMGNKCRNPGHCKRCRKYYGGSRCIHGTCEPSTELRGYIANERAEMGDNLAQKPAPAVFVSKPEDFPPLPVSQEALEEEGAAAFEEYVNQVGGDLETIDGAGWMFTPSKVGADMIETIEGAGVMVPWKEWDEFIHANMVAERLRDERVAADGLLELGEIPEIPENDEGSAYFGCEISAEGAEWDEGTDWDKGQWPGDILTACDVCGWVIQEEYCACDDDDCENTWVNFYRITPDEWQRVLDERERAESNSQMTSELESMQPYWIAT